MFDYAGYMRSGAWKARRVPVIRRSGGICERCGKWPVVNIHHITYERLGAERDEDLLGVCSKCHQELHRES